MDEDEATPEELIIEGFNRIRGRLCGLIESWGLDPKQERGAIQTLKTLTYDSQKEITEAVQSQ